MTGEKWAGECQAPGTKTSDGRAMVDLILCRSGLSMEVSKLNRIFHCLIGGLFVTKFGNEGGLRRQNGNSGNRLWSFMLARYRIGHGPQSITMQITQMPGYQILVCPMVSARLTWFRFLLAHLTRSLDSGCSTSTRVNLMTRRPNSR